MGCVSSNLRGFRRRRDGNGGGGEVYTAEELEGFREELARELEREARLVRRKGRCCRKEGEIRSNGLNIHRDMSSRSKYRAATATDGTAWGPGCTPASN